MPRGLHLRDPFLDPLNVDAEADRTFAISVLGIEPPTSEALEMARACIDGILAEVRVLYLPRSAVKLDGVRLIIVGDDVVWAGPTNARPPFTPYAINESVFA